jgi:hypothetical protein
MGEVFTSEVDRYRAKGYRVTVATTEGVTMVKPKRISIIWLLGTGVIPYLIYHVLFKSERSVYVKVESPTAS